MFMFKNSKKLAVVLTVVVLIALSVWFNINVATAVDRQIKVTMQEVSAQIDKSMNLDGQYYVNGLPLGLSSNPYDYVAANSEFNKLVAMGEDAILPIEKALADENAYSGLERYILAIALEDIAKVNLKNYATYQWQDSDSFLTSWLQMKADVADEVPRIMSNTQLSRQEKWAEITKFGTFAVEPLQKYTTQLTADKAAGSTPEFAAKIINLLTTSNKETVISIATSEIDPPN
jgi:hypothetical protein